LKIAFAKEGLAIHTLSTLSRIQDFEERAGGGDEEEEEQMG